MSKVLTCCICGKPITHEGFKAGEYFGNNPWPVSKNENDRCCDFCNGTVVIPTRIEQMRGGNS